jgi:hypothetical protein
MAGVAAGLCLLLVTALGCIAAPKPERHLLPVPSVEMRPVFASVPHQPDGRARASPRILQRFRN